MPFFLHRYPSPSVVWSALDPLNDVVSWIKGLRSKNYLSDVIKERHLDVSPVGKEFKARISMSSAHLAIACDYLEQGLSGPESVSFLPLYYAFLNLAKVYIALGPLYEELPRQRLHGVRYELSPSSANFMRDQLHIQEKGAIPLFYHTVTGQPAPSNLPIKMSQVYRYMPDVSSEFHIATGMHQLLRPARLEAIQEGEFWRVKCSLVALGEGTPPNANKPSYLPTLKGRKGSLTRKVGSSQELFGVKVLDPSNDPPMPELRETFRPCTIITSASAPTPYLSWEENTAMPIMLPVSSQLVVFGELPILLAFFHMSSIVRYHPEFHRELMDSKYWPLLLTLRRHGTYSFLLQFWSFMRQESFYFQH